MGSALKVSVAVLVAAAIILLNKNESIHPKGLQVGEPDVFLTRDNPIKNPFPVSTPKGDREDRG
ncbi:MAG: hypothetical protein AAB605_01395 [Patescibacteria group bacterium]